MAGQLTFPAAFSSPHRDPDGVTSSPRIARPNAASAHVQIRTIPVSTARQMDQVDQQDSSSISPRTRLAAFSVHVFTAMGAGIALIALLEAVREHWAAMFAWRVAALVIDALDVPVPRAAAGGGA